MPFFKSWKRFASVSALLLAVVAANPARGEEANALTSEELADGWILLFDGETTFGWRPATKTDWKVADGIISANSGERGLLRTTSQFGDYVLKVDFRAAKGTNSGIFLRTPPIPKDVASDAYE
ncbi:MAG: DUF1080 domain-containing protein, partial [Planctomycetales bacterium]